ncbi:MAG TPA: hypothetical protein VIL57_09895 [Bacteroidia bacterium]
MKKLLLTSLFAVAGLAVSAQVQNNLENASVKSTFESKFNAAPVSYTTYEDGTVHAKHATNNQWSVFKVDGTYLQTETAVSASEVPAAVKQDASQRFGNDIQYRKVVTAAGEELYSIIYVKGTSTVEVYYKPSGEMHSRAIR